MCLREALSIDGGPIYYLQFLLLYCLMPVYSIKRVPIFSFILQLAVVFILSFEYLSLIIIANNF